MYLCHKCAGVLAYEDAKDIEGLLDCSCISGYYRGFEKFLTRDQAIEAQIEAAKQLLALYERQGRGAQHLDYARTKLELVSKLRKEN